MNADKRFAVARFATDVFTQSSPAQLKQGDWTSNTQFIDVLQASWISQFADYIGEQAATEHVTSLHEQGSLFTDDPELTIHAWKDERIVGVSALRSLDGLDLITMFEVHPDYRGLGIGTQLLSALCQSSHCLMAHVSIHQPRARKFYQRSGFQCLNRQKVKHGRYCLEFDVLAKKNESL